MSIEAANSSISNVNPVDLPEEQNNVQDSMISKKLEAFILDNQDVLFPVSLFGRATFDQLLNCYAITKPMLGEFQKTLDKVETLARAHDLIPAHAERSKENAAEATTHLINQAQTALKKLEAHPEIVEELDAQAAEAFKLVSGQLKSYEDFEFFGESFLSAALVANTPALLSSLTLLAAIIDSGDEKAIKGALCSFIRQYTLQLKKIDLSIAEVAPISQAAVDHIDGIIAKLESEAEQKSLESSEEANESPELPESA